ncbi:MULTISPECIES: ABC transporter permease [unclassified Paenibacillus]|nr:MULTISPECIES: ABC transporter permease [unclassified Paenibacillus]MDF9844109.1 putative ABC transport system permease protein [Paenibacillus sp. PastF-2]MDH6482553.1 putative ABC transport system permease protein [Paenibacillus sp. PastH-2]
MTVNLVLGTLELGLIYGVLSLGLFISFRILNVPDLTVDGSFVTGAAVSAVLTTYGHAFYALPMAFIFGCIAGSFTAFLHVKLKIELLLSGILVMSALYSLNIKILSGKPNIPLLNVTSIFNYFNGTHAAHTSKLVILVLIAAVLLRLLGVFLTTKFGLAIRATGNNEQMARAVGVNTNLTKWTGLALSNGFVALSGAILAQYQSFVDIGMGVGVIVTGLASVIIGEVILVYRSLWARMAAVIVGSITYRFIIALALQLGMPPTDLKLMSSLIVALALSLPVLNKTRGKVKRNNNY